MAVTILMPKLGLTMTAGAVALWIAEEGQRVSVGEIIVEVITEKITYQMEARPQARCSRSWWKKGKKCR